MVAAQSNHIRTIKLFLYDPWPKASPKASRNIGDLKSGIDRIHIWFILGKSLETGLDNSNILIS